MASNSIKIYNDTVLKQSVLQGYQVQRTNDVLGKFTMGELAFTRDTGRLFVGNFTNTVKDDDTKYVSGGILVGNKYLGLIDSKPLLHFSGSGSTGWKPLNYQEKTKDETTGEEEQALFGSKSRFRRNDDTSSEIQENKNGWNKKAQFIEEYGVYSGDYTFDIYNNALILFDKNITTNQNQQPVRKIVNNKETIYDRVTSEEIPPEKQKRRTPLYDVSYSENDNLAERPIYGNGYVVMRIIEPDGITLKYKDRTFKNNDGTVNEDGSPVVADNNWSHNYIEINSIPASTLEGSFDPTQFDVQASGVRLKSELPNISRLKGNKITLPPVVSFSSDTTNYISLNFSTVSKTPKTTNVETDNILVLQKGSNNIYSVGVAKQKSPQFRIQLTDGLINPNTGENYLIINESNSLTENLAIGVVANVKLTQLDSVGSSNPFYYNTPSTFFYNGTGYYDINGSLKKSEVYDLQYATNVKDQLAKFDTVNNVGLNMLKAPLPICWNVPLTSSSSKSNTSAKLEYLVAPYVHCIRKQYINEQDYYKTQTSTGEDGTSTSTKVLDNEKWENNICVLGNNENSKLKQTSTFALIDGYSYDPSDREMYNNKIVGNTATTKIATSLPYDLASLGETSTATETETSTEVGEEIITKVSININSNFTPDLTKFTYPNNVTTFLAVTNEDETVTPDMETMLSYESLFSLVCEPGSSNYIPASSDSDILNLTQHIVAVTDESEAYISKIELSTNSTTAPGLITIFDKNTNLSSYCVKLNSTGYTAKSLYSTNNVNIIHYEDEYGAKYIKPIWNSSKFINETTCPYFIKVTYGSNGENEKYIKFEDIVYSDRRYDIDIDNVQLIGGWKSLSGSSTSITIEKFKSDYFDTTTKTFNTKNVVKDGYKSFLLLNKETETRQVSPETKVTKDSSVFVPEPVKMGDYEVTFKTSGVTDTEDNDFVITKVVYTTENNTKTTYLWSNTNDRETIKELLNTGAISIPTFFEIEVDQYIYQIIDIKTVPTHENGYVLATDELTTQNKVTIPAHAQSVILEVHRKANTQSAISILTSSDVNNLSDSTTAYDFPFTITSGSLPQLNSNIIKEHEKLIYTSTQSGCEIIEVPIYKTSLDGYKGFNIRLNNVDCGNVSDKFLIRLIGYRV